jgi:hypothetical protein
MIAEIPSFFKAKMRIIHGKAIFCDEFPKTSSYPHWISGQDRDKAR